MYSIVSEELCLGHFPIPCTYFKVEADKRLGVIIPFYFMSWEKSNHFRSERLGVTAGTHAMLKVSIKLLEKKGFHNIL